MPAFLVRHARAGQRSRWSGDDRTRPLDEAGETQAKAVATLLGHHPIGVIVSSPFLRCVQTVEPLASEVGVPVTTSEHLGEGHDWTRVQRLLDDHADDTPVLCSHGDVIDSFLEHLHSARVISSSDRHRHPKGCVWELRLVEGAVVGATFHPPG